MASKYIKLYRDEQSARERQRRHLQQLAEAEQRALQAKAAGSNSKKARQLRKATRKAQRRREWAESCTLAYTERLANLRSIGFRSYKEYLKSELWRSIRDSVLLPQTRCYACSRLATQVHHKSYSVEVLLGQKLDELLLVCGKCHHRAEFAGNNKQIKVDPDYATEKLARQAQNTTDNLRRAFERAFDKSWESE